MNKAAVYHRADSEMCYLGDDGKLCILLRCAKGEVLQAVLCFDERYDARPPLPVQQTPMEKWHTDGLFDYFGVSFSCPYSRVSYYFLLSDAPSKWVCFCQEGFLQALCPERQQRFQMPYLQPEDAPHVPQWLRESVAYQVFPDSFAQGEGRMEPSPGTMVTEAGITVSSRLGGTLRGVIENLPYLQKLGINLLYLNPIFTATSYHKYDVVDYYHIDPCLGTDGDFRELVETCHAMGIRVMLDLVFNHMGRWHPIFQDVEKTGAQSAYADWFSIRRFPLRDEKGHYYDSFAFVSGMPKIRTEDPKAAAYLLDITKYWLREFHVDGYRLDVANEVCHSFWRQFRKEAESVRPDVAIIGEIWHEAHSFIGRDQFHSVMNFPLMYAVWQFFAQDAISASDFSQTIGRLALLYPRDNVAAMMNFLDNHDTLRFFSVCGRQEARLYLAGAFLMSYVGMPLLFAGDEVGMEGGSELETRQCMRWQRNAQEEALTEWFRRLIHLRRTHPALLDGTFRTAPVDASGSTAAFWREKGEERILCLFHNGQGESVYPLAQDDRYTDLLTGQIFSQQVSLAPFGSRLLKKRRIRRILRKFRDFPGKIAPFCAGFLPTSQSAAGGIRRSRIRSAALPPLPERD